MCSERRRRCEPEAGRPLLHLRLCLGTHLSAISPVVEGVMDALKDLPCEVGADFAIETALREASSGSLSSSRRMECRETPPSS
jgi:hypothetical protein